MQDYKSLCVVLMICAILVNTCTHRQLFTGYTIGMTGYAKKIKLHEMFTSTRNT